MIKKISKNDFVRRNLFLRNELQKRISQIMQQNVRLNNFLRTHYSLKLNQDKYIDSYLNKIRNRCIITGRGRSIYRDFRLSRMQLRHLASFGYLMGIKKSSW